MIDIVSFHHCNHLRCYPILCFDVYNIFTCRVENCAFSDRLIQLNPKRSIKQKNYIVLFNTG